MLSKKSNSRQFDAIGTHWEIITETPANFAGIESIIANFDKNFSRFRSDSLVSKMAKFSGVYDFPDPEMLSLYEVLYEKTNGLITPLIGKVLEDAGYDSNYSLNPKTLTKPPSWDSCITWRSPKLVIKQPVLLDFGAAGKGRLIDLVSNELLKMKVETFIVDAGGDIKVVGQSAKIGLEHPENSKEVIGFANVSNQAIAGSAGNRRKWGSYHHIINPETLTPVNSVKAVWTIAKTVMFADALSTCLFFVSPERLSDFEFEYLIVYSDYTFKKSLNFPGEIYEMAR